MQSDDNYLIFGITRIAGRRSIALYTRDHGPERRVSSASLAATGPVTLTLRIDRGTLAVDYAVAGHVATLARDIDIRFLSTTVAGGFTGTLIGPYIWQH